MTNLLLFTSPEHHFVSLIVTCKSDGKLLLYNIYFGRLGTNWMELCCNYIGLHASWSEECNSAPQELSSKLHCFKNLCLVIPNKYVSTCFDKDDRVFYNALDDLLEDMLLVFEIICLSISMEMCSSLGVMLFYL